MATKREELFNYPDIYNLCPETSELFLDSMKEVIEYQRENNSFYRKLTDRSGFTSKSLKSESDLSIIPYIHANFFKTHEVLSIPKNEIFTSRTSSGTTGQNSKMSFSRDEDTIGGRIIFNLIKYFNIIDLRLTNYLLYSRRTSPDSELGAASTNELLTRFAPADKIYFALSDNGEGLEFNALRCIKALKLFENEGRPVRILGFPQFLHATVEKIKSMNFERLNLHPDSLLLLGGGWKKEDSKRIPKKDFYKMINELTGIKTERCREFYAALEHPVPYFECKNHNLHIPIYSRVLIRDVRTMEVLPSEKVGLLNFVCPYIRSSPVNSIVMGDLAVVHEAEKCGCGIKTPYMEIVGRSGINKSRGCAISAGELLKR